MLIVEGPDGSGKTTLIGELEKRLGVTREPRAVSHEAVPLRPMGQYIVEEIARGFGRRIYDRFALISSPFYCMLPNPTFREELLERDWLDMTWMKFRQVGAMIIICLPPLETVLANVMGDDDNEVVKRDISTIYWLYHSFAASYPFIATVYDYTKPDSMDNVSFALEVFEARLQRNEEVRRLKAAGLG